MELNMKKYILLCVVFMSSVVFANSRNNKQFPEDERTYVPRVDRGWSQYLARTLYGANKIVLTFDDGPHPTNTPKLLDILKEENVKATFFVLTDKINSATLPIIKRMYEEGHLVASHHHTHTNSNSVGENSYKSTLKKSILKLEEVEADLGLFQNEMYYRFPYGAYGQNAGYHHFNVMKEVSDEVYGDNCINFVFWDIDTDDWLSSMTSSDIKDNIIAQVFGGTAYRHKAVSRNGRTTYIKETYQVTRPIRGGVVLMHDIHAKTVVAAQAFIKEAKQLGIELATLDQVNEYQYGSKVCTPKN